MSKSQCSDTRQYLLKVGLIKGELKKVSSGQSAWHLSIPEIWKENLLWREALGNRLKVRVYWKQLQKAGDLPDFTVDNILTRLHEISELESGFDSQVEKGSLYEPSGEKGSHSEPLEERVRTANTKGSPGSHKGEPVEVYPKVEVVNMSVNFFTNEIGEDDGIDDYDRMLIDENGDEINAPKKFTKDDPFFKLIMDKTKIGYKTLQGAQKTAWENTILFRAHEDRDFRKWCIFEAEEFAANAKSKTLNTYLQWVADELKYADWLQGGFVKKDELESVVKATKVTKGIPQEKKPERTETTDEEIEAMVQEIKRERGW
jgi:hypothetical protein